MDKPRSKLLGREETRKTNPLPPLHPPHLHRAPLQRHPQHLLEEPFQRLPVNLSKVRHGPKVRRVARCQHPEPYVLPHPRLDLPRAAYPHAVPLPQPLRHPARIVGRLPPGVLLIHRVDRGQVQRIPPVTHKVRPVVLRQPLPQARRQPQVLLGLIRPAGFCQAPFVPHPSLFVSPGFAEFSDRLLEKNSHRSGRIQVKVWATQISPPLKLRHCRTIVPCAVIPWSQVDMHGRRRNFFTRKQQSSYWFGTLWRFIAGKVHRRSEA